MATRSTSTRGRRKPQLLKIDDTPLADEPAVAEAADAAEVEESEAAVAEKTVTPEPEEKPKPKRTKTSKAKPAPEPPSLPFACLLDLLDEEALRVVTRWAAACDALSMVRNRLFLAHVDAVIDQATTFNRSAELPRIDLSSLHTASGMSQTYGFPVYLSLWEHALALYPASGASVDGGTAVLPPRRVMRAAEMVQAYQRRVTTVDRDQQREMSARLALAYLD